MSNNENAWTNQISEKLCGQREAILQTLCTAFNVSPFFAHNHMQMRVADGRIEAFMPMQPDLIGNTAFRILHGGAICTLLDSIGGITAMAEIYTRSSAEEFADAARKVERLATLDLRVDYVAPGRGESFVAHAETLRLGRKSCLMRMDLRNDQNTLIATGIGTYSF